MTNNKMADLTLGNVPKSYLSIGTRDHPIVGKKLAWLAFWLGVAIGCR